MLTDLKISKVFLEIIPARFMELSLRALGNAKVDTKNRKLEVDHLPLRKEDLQLPQELQVIEKLGTPAQASDTEDYREIVYRYRLKGFTPDAKDKERGIATTTLRFDKKSKEMIYARCKFAGLKISINYEKWREKLV
jgi:hypothetical protein